MSETSAVTEPPPLLKPASRTRATWVPSERIAESSPVHEAEEADAYDRMVARHRRLLNAPFVDLVSGIGVEHARVLDIGCGPGWIPCELARRHPGWQVVALDPSAEMLARGRQEARRLKVEDRVVFRRGAACDLPFSDGSFDIVISNYVLHHVDEPEVLFNEAGRVLRAGGRAIVKDLLRVPSWQAAILLKFSRYALGYDDEQLRLYAESLRAAYTLQEMRISVSRTRLKSATARRFRVVDGVLDATV